MFLYQLGLSFLHESFNNKISMSCLRNEIVYSESFKWLPRTFMVITIRQIGSNLFSMCMSTCCYLIATLQNNTEINSHSKQKNLECTCACCYFNIHTQQYNRVYGLYSERQQKKCRNLLLVQVVFFLFLLIYFMQVFETFTILHLI